MIKSRFTLPCITIEQAANFNYDRPETWTKSILANAIFDALERVRPLSRKSLAAYLGIDPRDVNYGLHALTGMALPEFMIEWRKLRFKRALREEPGISGKEMADRLAFVSQGALWTFLTNNKLIKPLTHQGWKYGNHIWLHKQVEQAAKVEKSAEMNRRKWEYLTKNSK